jgi:peptidoglycan-N-acetylglucosamine deacetylase
MLSHSKIKRAVKQSFAWANLGDGVKDSVLLTFDDGPHPETTPTVLRLLKQYDARAIFFVVGARIERAPHLLNRILEEGHLLGNHSYAHPVDGQPWFGAYLKDLAKCQEAVGKLTGTKPKLFRPPLGRFSFNSMVAPRLLGLMPVLWSIDARDWGLKSAVEARAAAERLAERLSERPRRNDIVLMHDDHSYTGTILETILPLLSGQNCDLRSALDTIQ